MQLDHPTLLFGAVAAATMLVTRKRAAEVEPLVWLEETSSETALNWVRAQNKHCFSQPGFGSPKDTPIHDKILDILESKDKIPYLSKIGEFYYNFWTDDKHVKGIWRRTSLGAYKSGQPSWETVLDLDALNEQEDGGKNSWVWKGYSVLDEGPDVPKDLCLLHLSPGGSDAVVVREFSLKEKRFLDVDAEHGFFVPEAKTRVSYKHRDLVLVGTDFGKGSLTSSGYPRQIKAWKRGTPLSSAKLQFEGKETDVAVNMRVIRSHGHFYEAKSRSITFYESEYFLRVLDEAPSPGRDQGDDDEGEMVRLDLPAKVEIHPFGDQMLIELREDWRVSPKVEYKCGSLLSVNVKDFLAGERDGIMVLFKPQERVSLEGYTTTKNVLVLSLLDNVKGRLEFWDYNPKSSSASKKQKHSVWTVDEAASKRLGGQVSSSKGLSFDKLDVWAVDEEKSDQIWMTQTGFTTPTNYLIADATGAALPELLKSLPKQFDATGLTVSQHFVASKDGTMVPYFQVSKENAKGPQPTLLYGYGGFQISLLPGYRAVAGAGWMEKGGVYVIANIRGGGEFGPTWHQAALREKRQRAYEDFEAVAQDLVSRNVTTTKQLGAMGGSNGGLLMGNMLVRSPELFGAIVCMVPLLDMKRYNRLLAGASWMAEYGNPDVPSDWEFMKHFSPYHMLKKSAQYPPTLFLSSTKDDRVCPSHARKMVHKMRSLGHKDVYYFENIEGGHGGAADNKQRAFMWSLAFSFLSDKLG